MAEYTFDQLKDMTVAQLREIATGVENEALQGFTTMHKEQLLPQLCKALNVPMHAHHDAGAAKVVVKTRIHLLKKQRDAALEAHDRKPLPDIRRELRHLRHKLRKMTA